MSVRVGSAVEAARSWASNVPTQVAIRSTAGVAAVYLVLSLVVTLIVSHNLTSAVDQHLASALQAMQQPGTNPNPGASTNFGGDPFGRRFGGPVAVWIVDSDGDAQPYGRNASLTPALPSTSAHVTSPTTVSIAGTDVRLDGAPFDYQTSIGGSVIDGWVVVGQNTASIDQARNSLIVAEVVVFPLLLLLVFFGALTVGRRVAAPIERARQRQLAFTADASHELRTPLAVIEAETTLVLSRPREPEAYQTAFKRVDVEAKRLRKLVDDLLWLARFDTTPEPPDSELVDLGTLAGGAVERFRSVAERRSQHLYGGANGSGPTLITAPPDWLDRLLGVLLDNACRYSGEGGEVRVTVVADGSTVRLSVDDSGPGIPPEERAHVFDRFHRASTTPGGAGLGLAIGDAIVRATGGRWSVGESAAGGASMTVIWPVTVSKGNGA